MIKSLHFDPRSAFSFHLLLNVIFEIRTMPTKNLDMLKVRCYMIFHFINVLMIV